MGKKQQKKRPEETHGPKQLLTTNTGVAGVLAGFGHEPDYLAWTQTGAIRFHYDYSPEAKMVMDKFRDGTLITGVTEMLAGQQYIRTLVREFREGQGAGQGRVAA